MDRADRRVAQQVVEVGVDPPDPQPIGQRPRPVGRRAEQADHRDPDPPQRLDVDRADEAAADHRDPGRVILHPGNAHDGRREMRSRGGQAQQDSHDQADPVRTVGDRPHRAGHAEDEPEEHNLTFRECNDTIPSMG